MSKTLATVLVVGLLLITALTGYALVSAVQTVTNAPATAGAGLVTQVNEIMHPTPKVYPDPVSVVLQVKALSRLESAQYTIEKVITAETGQGSLGALFGDRLLFVGHGDVIAGVDLSRVQTSDITITEDGRVTFIMPAPEIFFTALDNDKSYVYDRETGLFTKGDENLETQARQVATVEIERAALEGGILTTAQTNAQAFMESLLISLGFSQVVIVQATPIPPATP
ncbi:MAG: DUF4230 domain-containing protein [Anaerolineales bacterium]|nr:DUF4230 domain-containing protein [Anaerolineales bacterium]